MQTGTGALGSPHSWRPLRLEHLSLSIVREKECLRCHGASQDPRRGGRRVGVGGPSSPRHRRPSPPPESASSSAAGPARRSPARPRAGPVVTRAALDPALVAGRGASVAFLEQEAENATTNGEIIAGRDAYTLPAEASGRRAVKLTPGQYVEFTLPADANAITVRYSIPDAPNGGGITAPLEVKVKGDRKTMTLTSQYAWLYNQYPFTNDPNAGLLHPDWWITECKCVPGPGFEVTKPFRPMKFYDEQRLLLGKTYRAGDKIRLTAPAGRTPPGRSST